MKKIDPVFWTQETAQLLGCDGDDYIEKIAYGDYGYFDFGDDDVRIKGALFDIRRYRRLIRPILGSDMSPEEKKETTIFIANRLVKKQVLEGRPVAAAYASMNPYSLISRAERQNLFSDALKRIKKSGYFKKKELGVMVELAKSTDGSEPITELFEEAYKNNLVEEYAALHTLKFKSLPALDKELVDKCLRENEEVSGGTAALALFSSVSPFKSNIARYSLLLKNTEWLSKFGLSHDRLLKNFNYFSHDLALECNYSKDSQVCAATIGDLFDFLESTSDSDRKSPQEYQFYQSLRTSILSTLSKVINPETINKGDLADYSRILARIVDRDPTADIYDEKELWQHYKENALAEVSGIYSIPAIKYEPNNTSNGSKLSKIYQIQRELAGLTLVRIENLDTRDDGMVLVRSVSD